MIGTLLKKKKTFFGIKVLFVQFTTLIGMVFCEAYAFLFDNIKMCFNLRRGPPPPQTLVDIKCITAVPIFFFMKYIIIILSTFYEANRNQELKMKADLWAVGPQENVSLDWPQ